MPASWIKHVSPERVRLPRGSPLGTPDSIEWAQAGFTVALVPVPASSLVQASTSQDKQPLGSRWGGSEAFVSLEGKATEPTQDSLRGSCGCSASGRVSPPSDSLNLSFIQYFKKKKSETLKDCLDCHWKWPGISVLKELETQHEVPRSLSHVPITRAVSRVPQTEAAEASFWRLLPPGRTHTVQPAAPSLFRRPGTLPTREALQLRLRRTHSHLPQKQVLVQHSKR